MTIYILFAGLSTLIYTGAAVTAATSGDNDVHVAAGLLQEFGCMGCLRPDGKASVHHSVVCSAGR